MLMALNSQYEYKKNGQKPTARRFETGLQAKKSQPSMVGLNGFYAMKKTGTGTITSIHFFAKGTYKNIDLN